MRGIRTLLVGATALALIVGPTAAAQAAGSDPIVMPDPQLRACVNAYLGQAPEEVITEDQAASVFNLDCYGFSDLTGLPALTGLTQVSFSGEELTDLSPLGGMPWLTEVFLDELPDQDFSVLTMLPNLERLGLGALIDYQQGNLDFVGGITTLTELHLDNNALTALPDLSGLVDLYHLGVYDNELTDLSFVADLPSLGVLDITGNRVSDLSPLASAPGPLEVLYLSENAILDLRPLAGLNLMHMEAMDQLVELPEVTVGQGGNTPPLDLSGAIVPLLPGSAAVTVDAVAGSWLLTTPGAHSLTWSQTFTMPWNDVEFSGTILQSALAATPPNPSPPSPPLAATGVNLSGLGGVGVALLLAGVTAVFVSRRLVRATPDRA